MSRRFKVSASPGKRIKYSASAASRAEGEESGSFRKKERYRKAAGTENAAERNAVMGAYIDVIDTGVRGKSFRRLREGIQKEVGLKR